MPTTAAIDDGQSTTPGRDLRLLFDVDETCMVQPGWEHTLTAAEMGRLAQGAGSSTGVTLDSTQSASAWELSSVIEDRTHLAERDPAAGVVYRLADFGRPPTSPPCVAEAPLFRAPTDIPGVVVDGAVPAAGDYWLYKVLTAGANTALNQFLNDPDQHPYPELPTADVPMDRLLIGNQTDAGNTAYHVRFFVPHVAGRVPDSVLTFYFGSRQAPDGAGAYCLAFRGNGRALLFLMGVQSWLQLFSFHYAPPSAVAGRWHAVNITPRGNKEIRFEIASSSIADRSEGQGPGGGAHFDTRPPNPQAARFVANFVAGGMRPGKFATGPGVVRFDVRRDLLLWWQLARHVFDTATGAGSPGILENDPFVIPLPIVQNETAFQTPTPLLLQMHAVVPDGTTLIPQIRVVNDDLSDGAFLAGEQVSPSLWKFTPVALKQAYRDRYLFSTTKPFLSPRLYGVTIMREPVFDTQQGLNIWTRPTTEGAESGGLTATGPDRDPRHESGMAYIADLTGELVLLRRRARIRTKAQIAYLEKIESKTLGLLPSEDVLISNLAEFEMAHCEGQLMGTDDAPYPSPDWRNFEATMVGMWARAEDQYNFYRAQFQYGVGNDPVTGDMLPPFLTDVVVHVLHFTVGIPYSQLDIPFLPIRFFVDQAAVDEMIMAPRTRALDYVQKLVADYAGAIIFYDPNAGSIGRDGSPLGMWRMQADRDLTDPGAALWNFVFKADASTLRGRAPGHDWFSYPEKTCFIQRSTYKSWVEPPEANAIFVLTADNSTEIPGGKGKFKVTAVRFNMNSFNIIPSSPTATDRTHPDFLGRFVPYVLMDPYLSHVPNEQGGPTAAVNTIATYLYERIAHARKRFRFRAPWPLAADPSDSLLLRRRGLRFNDPITVNGFNAVLKSANPDPPFHASRMWGWFEGAYSAVGADIPE